MPNLTRIEKHSLCGLTGLVELYIRDNSKLVHIDEFALSTYDKDRDAKEWPELRKVKELIYINIINNQKLINK